MTEIVFLSGQSLTVPAKKGLANAGVTIRESDNPRGKIAACWGWSRGSYLAASNDHVLVFERAYLGNRYVWTSVMWDGLNGRADFCVPDKLDPNRFSNNFEMKPWKDDGEYIVIMGQVNGDMSLAGRNLTGFYEDIARDLSKKYNKPVFFRQHPLAREHRRGFEPRIDRLNGSLEWVLESAWLVVTYNSNSAVDSVLEGVPALSFDIGSMAYEVTGHESYDRITPDRTSWANKLAHCQWNPEEIETGAFWEQLKCKLEN